MLRLDPFTRAWINNPKILILTQNLILKKKFIYDNDVF